MKYIRHLQERPNWQDLHLSLFQIKVDICEDIVAKFIHQDYFKIHNERQ